MKLIKILLPEPAHRTLASRASAHGAALEEYCSAALTELAASAAGSGAHLNSNHLPVANHEPAAPSAASPPPPPPAELVSEAQLIKEIVAYLKRCGGSAEKRAVEAALFAAHGELFQTTYYAKFVGGGVPRWKKNIQFARNTARSLGLVASPEDSGRGRWELTEKGKNWQSD